MTIDHNKCLLLNCDFTPIRIIDWRRAVLWNIKYHNDIRYGIHVLEHYDDYILCANNKKIKVPAVARTTQYLKCFGSVNIKLSRKNLFTRDNFMCQYCGKHLNRSQLTYDHIIPKSRFSDHKKATSWTNVTTACIKCNAKKANKTPKEANMSLLNEPHMPKFSYKYLPWYDELTNIRSEAMEIWTKYINKHYEYERK